MTQYSYRAKKGPADVVEGVVDASNRDQAVEKISALGLLPVHVEERAAGGAAEGADTPPVGSLGLFSRVRSREVTLFSRQLASLIKSGVPILRAIDIIREQSQNPRFRQILSGISSDVKEGKTFSKSLEMWPSVFPSFYLAMVRAGEDSGTLQESLLRVAAYRQKQEEMLSKFRTAMAYPILMALVGLGTVVFMFTFVLPKLTSIFSTMGSELPLPTKIVIAISQFLQKKWFFLVGGLAVAALLWIKTGTLAVRRRLVSRLLLHIPVLNTFLLNNEFARFCRTLEVLIKGGIPILRALAVSIPILSNEVIKAGLSRSAADLEQGAGFGKSLKRSKVFPPFLVSLISVGEESGKLDEALGEIAEAYEHECDESIKVLTSLLEPAMILVMGLIVGFVVMAMLLPIFSMTTIVK